MGQSRHGIRAAACLAATALAAVALSLSASAAPLPSTAAMAPGTPSDAADWLPDDDDLPAVIIVPATAAWDFTYAQVSSLSPEQVRAREQSWTHPLPSGRLLSQYGPRAPIAGLNTHPFHNGIDLAAPAGTSIVAAGDGVVSYTGHGNRFLGLTGWVIVIEHIDGTSTAYNHMYEDGVLVEVGDEVRAGDEIALVGSAGMSTGPHLHFSAWVDGKAVNPVNYLQERGVEVPGGRATDDHVFGDPYTWDWTGAEEGDGDPIQEAPGDELKDPVEQTPDAELPEPEADPTDSPTDDPTGDPTQDPTDDPTGDPTQDPTDDPTGEPTGDPTDDPTADPTDDPSAEPTGDPTATPDPDPTATTPAPEPSATPSPSASPTNASDN